MKELEKKTLELCREGPGTHLACAGGGGGGWGGGDLSCLLTGKSAIFVLCPP